MKVRKDWVREVTVDWLTLNARIMEMSLEEVIYAMELENARTSARLTFLKRLTQRYNGIKVEELKKELL